jgi:hypothetical protein
MNDKSNENESRINVEELAAMIELPGRPVIICDINGVVVRATGDSLTQEDDEIFDKIWDERARAAGGRAS